MSSLMSIGKSAMFANYAALQTAGNNIANANTPGYSRQDVQFADAPGQSTTSGYFGKGVSVTTVARSYDRFLTSQAQATGSTAAADSVRLEKLSQLENVFPIGTAGVGYAAGEFMNSFVDMANNPVDSSARQVVLGNAQGLASRFRDAGDQLSGLQAGVVQDVKAAVGAVNDKAQQVAKLNQQIAESRGSGQPPNQLLDDRDRLIKEIGAVVNVSTIRADDGSIGMFIGGGQSLVLGTQANTLKAVPDSFDPTKIGLAITEGRLERRIEQDSLAGGSLAGLLKFQNEDLGAAQNQLGQMATAISGAVNSQQALGLDLRQPAGSGAPIFSVGSGRVLAAGGSGGNAGNATLSLTVSAASQVQASDYSLTFDGANFALTHASDASAVAGGSFTPAQLSAGVQFEGLTLQLTAGSAAAGDRFLLQPVVAAAQNMRSVLSDTKGLAAASPFTGSSAVANRGTATVASLVAASPAYVGSLSAEIKFTSGAGDYSWKLSNNTGTTTSTGTGTWTAGKPISLNGFELKLEGVPQKDDIVNVIPTRSVAASNGNALAFSRMANAAVVGASANDPGLSITDAYASTLANIGMRVQGGKTAASISGATASAAESARANRVGVNLDEEAAKLMQFQQSYQAAAKILQVAQSMFDSVLQIAR